MEGPARVSCKPSGIVFSGGMVVKDHMHGFVLGNLAFDLVKVGDERLMAVAGHVPARGLAGQPVQSGKERGRAIAPVVMGRKTPTARRCPTPAARNRGPSLV